jgi:hypothetical protein
MTGAAIQMSTSSSNPPCRLTDQGGGRFEGTPGTITLSLADVQGTTTFDCSASQVWDVTVSPKTAVKCSCAAKTFGFTGAAGKKYQLEIVFVQLPSPSAAVATLSETPCNQQLLRIDDTNPSIDLWVTM